VNGCTCVVTLNEYFATFVLCPEHEQLRGPARLEHLISLTDAMLMLAGQR
jgi:hypothetical protein